MKKRIYFLLAAIFATVTVSAQRQYTPDKVPNVHVADSTRYVSNPDGVLSPAAEAALNAQLARVWQTTTAEPVVVALNDIDERWEPDEFATRLFEQWGIGKKDRDNGLLILLLKDRRRMVMRTGYGLEGVLPDVVCGRIIRNDAIPHFREGDYDSGVAAAVDRVEKVLTDPVAAEEIRSGMRNNAGIGADNETFADVWAFVVKCAVIIMIGMFILVGYTVISTRRLDDPERYRRLNNIKPVVLFLTFFGLGLPLLAYLWLVWVMKRIRNHKRNCPNCGNIMRKLDEQTDNNYLTPAQDMEERLNSIDYDVWLCDHCGEKDVIPYVNRHSSYTECPNCHARTLEPAGNRIIQQPTTAREGRGERLYMCRNCGRHVSKPYMIAKLAAPVVIVGGGGFGRGGGGGFGGGSFGGGMTGGGGASGGW